VLDALVDRLAALRLPSRRVFAGLVLAFLGFGVLLGNAAGSRVDYSLADSHRPVKLVLPAVSEAPSGAGEEATPIEPPAVVEEPTPESPSPAPSSSAAAAPKSGASPKPGAGGGSGQQGRAAPAPGASTAKLPEIKHVFVIMLSQQPYAAVFGPESSATYLAHTLERRGELLVRYYAVAHQQLANGIALISGQGPTPATAANCPLYGDLAAANVGADEQVAGEGCVYPPTTATLPGQLEVKRLTWRAYVQGLGEGGAPACAHPSLGQPDASSGPQPSSPYATFRNPFAYFHGLTDAPACARDDVGLGALAGDLASAKRTPSFSYIVPDRCHDGSPGPCPGGGAGGLPAADGLLQQIVPKILASPAYKQGGLLVITVDQAPSSGELADSSSCCGQPQFPNLPAPSGPTAALGPEGGGQVGALLLSPFVKAKSTSQAPYNHFSLLRTIEDLFALKHLGYAAGAKAQAFEPSLFVARHAKK
jgi:phosphatidylinositol-3-phosphatase